MVVILQQQQQQQHLQKGFIKKEKTLLHDSNISKGNSSRTSEGKKELMPGKRAIAVQSAEVEEKKQYFK